MTPRRVLEATLEVVALMALVFAASLFVLQPADASSQPDWRDLTLYEDCGAGAALYQDDRGGRWLWRGDLRPAGETGCAG